MLKKTTQLLIHIAILFKFNANLQGLLENMAVGIFNWSSSSIYRLSLIKCMSSLLKWVWYLLVFIDHSFLFGGLTPQLLLSYVALLKLLYSMNFLV